MRRGEIVGLAGLMGAGRTEFARSLFGHSWGTNISGKVWVNGQETSVKTISQAMNAGIAYATEDRKRFGLNLIDDIKRKSFTAGVRLTDAQVASANLMETFIRGCKEIGPLMRFLAASTGVPW